jgi:hypothetical protein
MRLSIYYVPTVATIKSNNNNDIETQRTVDDDSRSVVGHVQLVEEYMILESKPSLDSHCRSIT